MSQVSAELNPCHMFIRIPVRIFIGSPHSAPGGLAPAHRYLRNLFEGPQPSIRWRRDCPPAGQRRPSWSKIHRVGIKSQEKANASLIIHRTHTHLCLAFLHSELLNSRPAVSCLRISFIYQMTIQVVINHFIFPDYIVWISSCWLVDPHPPLPLTCWDLSNCSSNLSSTNPGALILYYTAGFKLIQLGSWRVYNLFDKPYFPPEGLSISVKIKHTTIIRLSMVKKA